MQCGDLCLYESVWKFWNNCEKMQNFNFLVHFMAQKAEYRNPCQWHSVKVIIFTCYIGMLHSNIRVLGLNFKRIMIWYWKMVVDGTVHSWCMSPKYKAEFFEKKSYFLKFWPFLRYFWPENRLYFYFEYSFTRMNTLSSLLEVILALARIKCGLFSLNLT